MFININQAIEMISNLTKQKCNIFTLIHYISNGYLNIYFDYSGELYRKNYNAILQKNFLETDFTIINTEDYCGQLKLRECDLSEAIEIILLKNENYLVQSINKESGSGIYHALLDGKHQPPKAIDNEEFNALLDMLLETGELDPTDIVMKHCSQVDFNTIDRKVYLNKSNILINSNEISSFPLSHHALNRNGKFYASELGLALELWEEIYLNRQGVFPEGINLEKIINKLLEENYEIKSSNLKSMKSKTDETGRLKERLRVALNLIGKNKITKKVNR